MSLNEEAIEIIVSDLYEYLISFDEVDLDLILEDAPTANVDIHSLGDISITVDLDYLGSADDGVIPGLYRGVVTFPITFHKVVAGTKKTFGQIAFVITDNITTRGISGGEYGSGLYGSGLYGDYAGVSTQYGTITAAFSLNRTTSAKRTTHGSIARSVTFGAVTSGDTETAGKQTFVAQFSLASHGTPAVRTNHRIKIRARTVSGSGGLIKAALYEGAVNRSGDLTSTSLTNSLADYTLNISEAAAATITDYSNLSIKLWGYNASGSGLVFEVANVYLELPAP